MNWLRKFMYGRYGIDELSIFLVVSSLIFMALGRIFSGLLIFTVLSDVLIVVYLFRIFSKNIARRSIENSRYLSIKNKLVYSVNKKRSNVIEMKDYKILKCPECGQKLRVPRKKGKITVTCSKCKKEFKAKS